jgi:hypothetical protein
MKKKKPRALADLSVEIKLACERYERAIRQLDLLRVERLRAKAEMLEARREHLDALERDAKC